MYYFLLPGEGDVRAKQDSDRFQVKSCSDKIALWNAVGVQGALLSQLIDPIYLDTIVINENFNRDFIYRSLYQRFSAITTQITSPYKLDKIKLAHSNQRIIIPFRNTNNRANNSLIWIKNNPIEILNNETGKLHNGNSSCLSKSLLFARYVRLKNEHVTYYNSEKLIAIQYNQVKQIFLNNLDRYFYGYWVETRDEVDNFTNFKQNRT